MLMQPQKRLDELFRNEIDPNRHVVCIGPDESVKRDPSGFCAATLLYGKKGKLYFLDKQSKTLLRKISRGTTKNRALRARRKRLLNFLVEGRTYAGGAVGDPVAHAQQIKKLLEDGNLAKVPIVKIAPAHATGFPDKSIGTIIDAGSLPWIAIGEAIKNSIRHNEHWPGAAANQNPETFVKLLKEYGRVASKAILLAEPLNPDRMGGDGKDFFPSCEVLKTALLQAGAKSIREIAVQNTYKTDCKPGQDIPVFLHHGYEYTKALVAEW